MTWRVCAEPGCPEMTEGTRCPDHEHARQKAKAKAEGTFREKGYDAEYDRNRARVLAEETHCWLCGHPVDKALSGKLPDGPSVDHRIPISAGGGNGRDNLSLSHNRCNSGRRSPSATTPPPRRTPDPVKRERPHRTGSIGTR